MSINKDKNNLSISSLEDMQSSEIRYRRLFESACDGILILDAVNRKIIDVNPFMTDLLGYRREDLLDRELWEIGFHFSKESNIAAFSNFEQRDYIHYDDITLKTKNGERRLVEFISNIYTENDHQVIQCNIRDIGQRKQVEGWQSAVLDSLPSHICLLDLAGNILNVNKEWKRFALRNGYYQANFGIGSNYIEIFERAARDNVENAKQIAEVCRSVLAGKLSYFETEYPFHSPTKERWFKVAISAFHKEKLVGAIVMHTNITDSKKVEKELQESQQLLKIVIDTLPQASWWKDINSNFLGCNRFLAELSGFESPEHVVGLSDYDMPGTIEEADFFRECDRRVMETGLPELDIIETQLQHDGKLAWLKTNKVPFRNAQGEIIGVIGTFADITNQRRADAALRESEYKLRTLLESMREGLLQVDNDECIVFLNDRFCEMVGYSSDELMGTNWSRLLINDDKHDFVKQVNRRRREGLSDSYELRLRKKSGKVFWVIVGGAPILDAEGTVIGSMGVFTDITERKRAEEQLFHDALHDGLTGLANRILFTKHLQMTIDRTKRDPKQMFAVLFLDFDRFKVINDSLGHLEGDKLLKQIARRLESSLRSGDLVARLGGDEFTVLVNQIDDSSVALRVAERIQKSLQTPFEIGGSEIVISASIGIALSTTGHDHAEDMLRNADIAMYRAKAKGRAQHQVFDLVMHEHALKQLQLETEMRQALDRSEFLLHYQPIIDLETNALTGFESLVRWQHPERGMIPPFEFIGTAEENNLILPLGKWILHESCRQLQNWQNINPAASHLTISVNLSSKQFLQPDMAEQVADILEQTGLKSHCLKLEITESHIMENTELAIKTMSSLRDLGVELSIDDFGTGYSSLSYLHRLPANYLKIDRSFVTRMIKSRENSEIVSTIIKLAQNLKMKVVAEGIETSEELAQLRILNCEYGQGYFFAKPMESETAKLFIDKSLESYSADKFIN